jgi:prepilin-type processing-associated H-X9-DG protein
MRSIEPFPGSTLIASDPMISALYAEPMMIATLLPALNRAREQANRVKSASNLRQIGQAAMMYANENKNKYPPDLATMYKRQDLTPSVFINPRTETTPPPPGTPEEMAAWVQEHSDYVWIGGDKTAASPPEQVLAYEKLEENPEGVNVLFADGHVEFMPIPVAREAIDKSKQGNKVNGNL